MPLLFTFLFWLIGLPLILMLDAYMQGRFERTIFPDIEDKWGRETGIFFWPIYFPCMYILYMRIRRMVIAIGILLLNGIDSIIIDGLYDAMEWCHKKGKQTNDIDYQIEKYLLRNKDDE